jgi:pyruvate/2-oxoglutarate dehydrogenase complex dihydrolipoamide acyltransferase (E2) component
LVTAGCSPAEGLSRIASVRRKLAVATWRPSRDGRIYGRMVVDATPLLAYVDRARAETGVPVTVTHVVGKAVAAAVEREPAFHHRVVLGRLERYPSYDIGFAVDVDAGDDLAPSKVHDVDRLSVVEVARALVEGAGRLRSGTDRDFAASSRLVQRLPWFSLRAVAAAASLLNGGLGRRAFGQPGFPLGCAFVSNVGTFGLDEGFLAPVPFARVPLYVLVGRVHEAAAVVDGAVVVRPTLVLTATADHRVVDGAQAGRLAAVLKDLLARPEDLRPASW